MASSLVCFDPSTVMQSFYRKSIDGNGRSELVSLLQKAIRRNDARLARYAAMVLVGSQCIERVVTRLLVIISEDIGAADSWLAVETLAVLDRFYYPKRAVKGPSGSVQPWRSMRNQSQVRHFIMALATRFAGAEKSRLGDNCSHGYFKYSPEHDPEPAWLTAEERANWKLVLVPVMHALVGDYEEKPIAESFEDAALSLVGRNRMEPRLASFEEAMQRMGYLLGRGHVTTEKLCVEVVNFYAKREQLAPEYFDPALLRLMRALDRVRVLRANGNPDKGRCTLVHLFYLVWAIDHEEYVLPQAPADPVQAVLACYSQEQAEADFARFITGAWREPALPAYVRDFHTASASAISVSDWILREDQALQPRTVVIAQNGAALQCAHDTEAAIARRASDAGKKKKKPAAKKATAPAAKPRKRAAKPPAAASSSNVVVLDSSSSEGEAELDAAPAAKRAAAAPANVITLEDD